VRDIREVQQRYVRMSAWSRWWADLRATRCLPKVWQLAKVVDPSGTYYTIPAVAFAHPERAAWVQMPGAKEALKAHWLADVQWLPIMVTSGLSKTPATREEVAHYERVTASIAVRGWLT
jgi:hypothetical protein